MKTIYFYKQPDQMDCGSTCLRMIAKHYGKNFTLQRLREIRGINREGVSLLGISEAAEKIGFRTMGSRLKIEQLADLELPAILHWNQNHFVVLYRIRNGVYLNNTIEEQQAKFRQALNSMLNEAESWMMKYVVLSPLAGKVAYAGILQENQNVTTNQELFVVNSGNTNFFGEVQIPQYNMGKVKLGQRTLIKLRSYPFEEYGKINDKVSYITDAALKDSVFVAKIDFAKIEHKNSANQIVLKPSMVADAEIITQESSLLQRFFRNITKIFFSN